MSFWLLFCKNRWIIYCPIYCSKLFYQFLFLLKEMEKTAEMTVVMGSKAKGSEKKEEEEMVAKVCYRFYIMDDI